MLREREATGSVSLKDFYIRRSLRILPVFWLLLITVSVLKAIGTTPVSWYQIFRAFTFTYNYPLSLHDHLSEAWCIGHTWSLSLEEQFYLLWPITFVWLFRKSAARLALILALCGPLMPFVDRIFFPAFRGYATIEARIGLLMAAPRHFCWIRLSGGSGFASCLPDSSWPRLPLR